MSETHRTVGGNLGVSRRGFMRVGAGAAAAGAVGVGSTRTRFSPVQEGEAIAPVLGAGLVGLAAGAYAGARLYAEWQDNTADPDFSDQDDQQFGLEAWDKFNALQLQGEPQWHEMFNSFRLGRNGNSDSSLPLHQVLNDETALDSVKATSNVWSGIRKSVSGDLNEGVATGNVEANAKDAAELRITRSLVNVITSHNAEIDAMASTIAEDVNRGTGVVSSLNEDGSVKSGETVISIDTSQYDGMEPVVTTDDGNACIVELPLNWQTPPSELEGFDGDTLGVRSPVTTGSAGDRIQIPVANDVALANGDIVGLEIDHSAYDSLDFLGSHPFGIGNGVVSDFDAVVGVNLSIYLRAVRQLNTLYGNLMSSEIADYVAAVSDQIQAGEMSPEDILGPDDIVTSSDDGDAISRVTAELAASGFNVPQDIGNDVQFTVGHPDLPASDPSEMTGWLYLDLDASAEQPLNLSAGDTLASGNYSAAYLVYTNEDGESDYSLLSGDSDLSIVEIHGQDDDGNDLTSLDFNNYTPSVSDPNNPEDLQATVEAVNDLRDEIEQMREEEAAESGGGAGGFLDFGDGGSQLGILALGAAVVALLWGGSSGN